jgi:hypothetical protein
MVDLHEIQYGEHAIEGDLDGIFFSPAALIIPKWWALKYLRWRQNLDQSLWDHEFFLLN